MDAWVSCWPRIYASLSPIDQAAQSGFATEITMGCSVIFCPLRTVRLGAVRVRLAGDWAARGGLLLAEYLRTDAAHGPDDTAPAPRNDARPPTPCQTRMSQ